MTNIALAQSSALYSTVDQPVDFWALIQGRRSIRRYQNRPLARDVIEKLLLAATWAPSAHNRQPWRFCVITDAETKERLCLAMAAQWRKDLARDRLEPAQIEQRIATSRARMMGAAALIVAALSMADMDVYSDQARNQAEWTMAVQSTALACQNLLLAAHYCGLGACWMCAPLFVPELVRDVLDLPKDWQAQALITIGYPAEKKSKERVPLETRVLWR